MRKKKEIIEEIQLTEADRRALRGSRFAPLPPQQPSASESHPRLAHPGGPLATNKAAALAKFLERKLKEPGGLDSINPDLLEVAVKNAKDTLKAASGNSSSGRMVRHVDSFGNSNEGLDEDKEDCKDRVEVTQQKKPKEKKKRKKTAGSKKAAKPEKHKKRLKS